MPKPKSNIEMYVEVAQKIGLSTEYVQSTPTRKPLLISNGSKFFLLNTKSPGFYPSVHRWSAHFTRSKLLTQKILARFGYKIIETDAVRIATYSSAKALEEHLREQHGDKPVLLKPDQSYDGKGIEIIDDPDQFTGVAEKYFESQTDFLLQPIYNQTEYRILVVNYEVVLIHSKKNLCVEGDGESTIAELLSKISKAKKDNVYIDWQYKKTQTTPDKILKIGEKFDYHLTKIPTNEFYMTKNFPSEVVDWSVKLAKTISSPVVGIDVFIPESITDTSSYTIIELNSNPALYYLPTRCNDNVTPYKIIEKILRDFFKLRS